MLGLETASQIASASLPSFCNIPCLPGALDHWHTNPSRIGRASALALAQAGAPVLIHYNSNPDEAEAVAAEIRRVGGKAEKVGAALSKPNGQCPRRIGTRREPSRSWRSVRMPQRSEPCPICSPACRAESSARPVTRFFARDSNSHYGNIDYGNLDYG
jgi:hypothetical protein